MRRRPKIVPHQTKISTQNIKDYSTPEGASKANLEFRRLALAIEDLRKKPEVVTEEQVPPVSGGGSVSGVETEQKPLAKKKLSIYHNGSRIIGDNVEVINFVDTLYRFEITQHSIPFQAADVKILGEDNRIQMGIVPLNRLCIDMPQGGVPEEEMYKYRYKHIKPPAYYGWYVYGVIPNAFNLQNEFAYQLTLHQVVGFEILEKYTGSDYASIVYTHFPDALTIPQHEALANNDILVHSICKSDILFPSLYVGIDYEPEIEYIDEDEGIVYSNLVYYYILRVI